MELSLYRITEEMKTLEDLYWENIDEETGEIKNSELLEEFEKEIKALLVNKGAQIIAQSRNTNLMIDAVKTEITRLQKLKKSLESKENFYKKYIVRSMESAGIEEVKTDIGILKLKKGTGTTDVYDPSLLEEKFWRITEKREPAKDLIKKSIKAGEDVQGARILYENSLSIK
jgi:hypothetical protein